MKKRHISTKTVIEPFGLVTISGEVARNPDFDGYQQELGEPPFDIYNLTVTVSGIHLDATLEDIGIDTLQDILIEKFIDDEQAYQDTLIDEAIERGKEFARNAYA